MASSTQEKPRPAGGFLSTLLPPDRKIWAQVRELAANLEKRQDAAGKIADEDPVIVLEVLKAANAMAFSEGKPPITTTRGAFIRLGAQAGLERLDRLKDIPDPTDPEITRWLEKGRMRCRRTGKVSAIIAQSLAKTLVEDCQTAGILLPIGDMIAVMYLQNDYVSIASTNARAKLLYRLEKDFKFDPFKSALVYLKRCGMPDAVMAAIDPEAQTKTPSRAIMKPLCAAAEEFVSGFEARKWDKLAPESGNQLPPRSAIRLLDLSDSQYETLYTQIGEYLFTTDPEAAASQKK